MGTIKESVPVTNSAYTWQVGKVNDVMMDFCDDNFKVKISTEDNISSDFSDGTFSIADASEPGITVDNEEIESEYNLGDTIHIDWTTTCHITDQVRIVLRRVTSNGTLLEAITIDWGPPDMGSVNYTIPSTQIPGFYNIKAKAQGIYGLSKIFVIADPKITVTRPLAGSVFQQGDEMFIKWEVEGITERMRVVLRHITVNGTLIEAYTLRDVTPQAGQTVYYFHHTIDDDQETGYYNVKVKAQGIYGLSGRFQIVK